MKFRGIFLAGALGLLGLIVLQIVAGFALGFFSARREPLPVTTVRYVEVPARARRH